MWTKQFHRTDGRARAAALAAVGILGFPGFGPAVVPSARAGAVVRDGTVGPGGALPRLNGDFAVPASSGRQVGANLFHSFSRFDLDRGESATFTGPSSGPAVHNVLARVTGGTPSNIDGTIRCTIPDANFYLINPAGVVFGPGAALDVQGSFAVTTADVVRLSDGGRFNARTPSDSVLTTAAPAAFGFLSARPASVTVRGTAQELAVLSAADGKNLSIISGPVTIAIAALESATGRTNVVAVAAPGDVGLDAADPHGAVTLDPAQAPGAVQLSASFINQPTSFTPPPAGSVLVRGSDLILGDSQISARSTAGTGAAPADVDIDLTGRLAMTNSLVVATTADATPGGAIRVRAASVSMQGPAPTGGAGGLQTAPIGATGTGKGGDIVINAPSVAVKGGSQVVAVTDGAGDSGSIRVTADTLTVDGANAGGLPTVISVGTGTAGGFGDITGGSGDIRIDAKQVVLDNGGVITAVAPPTRDGGSIFVHTGTLDADHQSGLQASTDGPGNAGSITLQADGAVRFRNGSGVNVNTAGRGNAGALTLSGTDVTFDGPSSGVNAEAGTGDAATDAHVGRGGDVTLHVGTLSLLNGASISSDTASGGGGGDVTVVAVGPVRLTGGSPGGTSGITADTFGPGRGGGISIQSPVVEVADGLGISASTQDTGPAGNIHITAWDSLTVRNGGFITSLTLGGGAAGSVAIDGGGDVTVDRAGSSLPTGIGAQSLGGGAGGDVTIAARNLSVLNGGRVSVEALGTGRGGNLTVTASDTVRVSGPRPAGVSDTASPGLAASTTGPAPAGSITLKAGRLMVTAGASIQNGTGGAGDAGRIDVQADQIVLDATGSTVAAGASDPTGIIGLTSGGHGADISVTGRSVAVLNGAQIAAETLGASPGGNIAVTATESIRLNGSGVDANGQKLNTINANTAGTGSGGNAALAAPQIEVSDGATVSVSTAGAAPAGTLTVSAPDRLVVRNEGVLASITTGSGPGGRVTIDAGDVTLDRAGGDVTGVLAQSFGTGRGGDVAFKARNLTVLGGAQVSADAQDEGPGGSVAVTTAGRITLDGATDDPDFGPTPSRISAARLGAGAGAGGDVRVEAGSLSLGGGARVSTRTEGPGAGGTIAVTAGRVTVSGRAPSGLGIATAIDSETAGDTADAGNAGSVTLNAGTLRVLRGGAVSALSRSAGEAGTLQINARDVLIDSRGFRDGRDGVPLGFNTGIAARSELPSGGRGGDIRLRTESLRLIDQAQISAATANPAVTGGGIDIRAARTVYLRDSLITAQAAGAGGRITIDPPTVVLDHSTINGLAGGTPVVVRIATDNLLLSQSRILTNTDQTFPEVDISGSIAPLRTNLAGTGAELAPACGLLVGHDVSSFVVTGRGGESPQPGGWNPDWTMELRPGGTGTR